MPAQPLFRDVAELLPHAAPMILIDEVTDWGEGFLEARVAHAAPSLFALDDGSVPAWVGIEYMAQAIGAYAGIRARRRGEPVRIGFLLGAREYAARVPYFRPRQVVTVRVESIFRDEAEIAAFDCEIRDGGTLLAKAEVKAVQPDNPEDVFAT
ncbi:MAG TPA: 3-hydroxylacyl-ACP dehydratase [Gammaproteobacteria bacterium]|nr:3-hydroxylacyl-ACP dehydratase [Gammaproteobacteria bacterium]